MPRCGKCGAEGPITGRHTDGIPCCERCYPVTRPVKRFDAGAPTSVPVRPLILLARLAVIAIVTKALVLILVGGVMLATGCSVATYPGREVRTTARVGPPSSVEVQVDGTLRCRARGEMPLELRVFDCTKVRHVDGGMCQPPGAP